MPALAEQSSNHCFNDLDCEERGRKREDRGGWDGGWKDQRREGGRKGPARQQKRGIPRYCPWFFRNKSTQQGGRREEGRQEGRTET